MNISERLVKIREQNGYTRKRLADELGKPYATITKYETGEREPGHKYIIEVAKKFGVSTDYILGIEKTPNSEDPELGETEEWLETLLVERGYIKRGEDISKRDADFLIHWVGLLDAWFDKSG